MDSLRQYLLTSDGKRYGITSGLKTNEKESDLLLDSLFWMPESGTANLALHFKPVPQDTKEMDFSEGEGVFNGGSAKQTFGFGQPDTKVQRSTFNVQRSPFNVQRSPFAVQRITLLDDYRLFGQCLWPIHCFFTNHSRYGRERL